MSHVSALKPKYDEALSNSASNFNLRCYNVEIHKPFVARVVHRRGPSVQPRDPMQEAGACVQLIVSPIGWFHVRFQGHNSAAFAVKRERA